MTRAINPSTLSKDVREHGKSVPPKLQQAYYRASTGTASPRAAIKAFCLECVGWDRDDVIGCTAPACPLYQYRPVGGG